MFLSVMDVILMGIGWTLLIFWLIVFFLSKKYDELFENLEEKDFPLKELYGTGYWVMERIRYRFKSDRDRKLRQELEILYEKKYVEYYLRVLYARAVTYAMLLAILAFALYGLSPDPLILLIMLMFAVLAVYYVLTLPGNMIQKRSDELLCDFSEAVSKLALLTNAGMILREAWEQVSQAGEGVFYQEMQLSVADMNNGVSETEAIRRFGIRCMIPEIKKFSTTMIQGMQKGNSELTIMLQEQSSEIWNMRKQNIRREGEKASSKLMVPIFMMFVGILIMVIVPIFTNLGV